MIQRAAPKIHRSVFLIIFFASFFVVPVSRADDIPSGWEASNMQPIGYTGLDGRGGAFKMAIKHAGDHWYMYAGNFWNHGWDIIDVTDPTKPKLVKFIPGPEDSSEGQVDLHDNILITALQNRAGYKDPSNPPHEGVIIWDISDPLNPKQLSVWKTGATGTHRDGYPGGKYVNMSAGMPGFKGQILVFLDISDPTHPKEAGRWWMTGQKEGEPPLPAPIYGHHGPAFIEGDRAYLGYSPAMVILDIKDIANPKLIGQLTVSPPFGTNIPVHDAMPIPGRNLVFAHAEGTGGADTPDGVRACTGALYLVGLIDIADPTKPKLISTFPTPVPPKDAPYTDFCAKGGRFGPHNTNILQHSPDVEKQADLIYLTYFNAGLRVFNIRDARLPKEVGWFIPPTPTKRYGPLPYDNLVSQSEDVLVDARGNIFITDKQWGLWVLRYTGEGEPAPAAK